MLSAAEQVREAGVGEHLEGTVGGVAETVVERGARAFGDVDDDVAHDRARRVG